jgi:hypothetical protein
VYPSSCSSQFRLPIVKIIFALAIVASARIAGAQAPWIGIQAPATSVAPCATDNGSGTDAEIFVTGNDHIVYANAVGADGSLLFAWNAISGLNLDQNWFDKSVACTELNGVQYVFAPSSAFTSFPSGTIMMSQLSPGSKWTNWAPLPGGSATTTQALAATSEGSNVHLFRVGADQRIFENILHGGTWSGWLPIDSDPADTTLYGVAATVWGNKSLALFRVGSQDNEIYASFRDLAKPQSAGIFKIPQGSLTAPLKVFNPIAVTSNKLGGLEIFAVQGTGGTVMRNIARRGTFVRPGSSPVPGGVAWLGWEPLPGTVKTSAAPAAALSKVFVVSEGRLFVQLLQER